jgi:hypothetical protein
MSRSASIENQCSLEPQQGQVRDAVFWCPAYVRQSRMILDISLEPGNACVVRSPSQPIIGWEQGVGDDGDSDGGDDGRERPLQPAPAPHKASRSRRREPIRAKYFSFPEYGASQRYAQSYFDLCVYTLNSQLHLERKALLVRDRLEQSGKGLAVLRRIL